MFDAIVTFVTTESMDLPRAEIDSRIAAGEPVEYAATKVYRVEFESEDVFNDWMKFAEGCRAVNVEQLKAS